MSMLVEGSELGYWQNAKAFYERIHISTMMLATSMILANSVDRSALVVHADDALLRQAELAIPSALLTPNMGDYDKLVGVGSQIGLTVISAECARDTTGPVELAGTALVAQIASSGADAAVERIGWLSHAERAQEDVGFSAIYVAWFTKFLFDKAQASEHHRHSWIAGIGAFAVMAVIGLPLSEGSQGGKLDAVAHTTSLAVGFLAHRLSERRKSDLNPVI